MATRFYLPATAVATPISPTPSADWEDTSILARVNTKTAKINDTLTTVSFADANNANRDILFRQYISFALLAGQTITGAQAIKFQVRAQERLAGNNMFTALGVRIIAGDGSTVRKTMLAVTRDGLEIRDVAAGGLQNRQFTATSASGNYTVVDGDRLVFEVGTGGDPANSGGADHDTDLRLGDSSASDLAENDTETTDNNPWIELADTITFGYAINLAAGAYTLSGKAASLLYGHVLNLAAGTYLLSDNAAALLYGHALALDAGLYMLSGQAITLAAERTLSLAVGDYLLSGQVAGLSAVRQASLAAGSYTLTGFAAELTYTPAGGFSLTLDSGAYAYSGLDVSLTPSTPSPGVNIRDAAYLFTAGHRTEPVSRALTAREWWALILGREPAEPFKVPAVVEQSATDDALDILLML